MAYITFDTGVDILDSKLDVETGTVVMSVGSITDNEITSSNAEWWQTVGLCSLPAKVNGEKRAAQCITLKRSDRDLIIASRDLRNNDIYGKLAAGETCLYASGSQARTILNNKGEVVLMTTADNTKNGKGVYLKVGTDKLEFMAPWGRMWFDASGFHIVNNAGAQFSLGCIAGVPAPLDALATYCKITAGSTSLDSICTLGPSSSGIYSSAAFSPGSIPVGAGPSTFVQGSKSVYVAP